MKTNTTKTTTRRTYTGQEARNEHFLLMVHDGVSPHLLDLALRCGAEIEARDWLGRTPLMRAAMKGRTTAVAFLLEKGADATAIDDYDRSVLDHAGPRNRPEILSLLLSHGVDPNEGESLFKILNPESEDPESAEILIQAGADPNMRSRFGDEAVVIAAARCGSLNVMDTLLNAGADPNASSDRGDTPTMAALDHHDEAVACQVIRRLAATGADIDAMDARGRTALYRACEYGREGIVRTLIELGADPLIKRGNGWTAASAARSKGHERVASLLTARAAA